MLLPLSVTLVLAALRPAIAGEPFAFAVLSDTHIGHRGDDAARRLRLAIEKIRRTDARFVFITGDLTHNAQPRQYAEAKALLDTLPVPYFPILGNHDIWPHHERGESRAPDGDALFETTFGSVFRDRAAQFPGFIKEPGPVWNPERKVESYYQNYAFVYRGCAFVALDWVTRRHALFGFPGAHTQADLHDFPGGTYRWAGELERSGALAGARRVFFFQHHPPRTRLGLPDFLFGFSRGEKDKLKALLARPNHWGVFAGHQHRAYQGRAFDALLRSAGLDGPPPAPDVTRVDGLRQVETAASMRSSMVTIVEIDKDGNPRIRQF